MFKIILPITHNAPVVNNTSLALTKQINPSKALFEFSENSWAQKNEEIPLVLIIEDNKDVAYYLNQCLYGQYKTIHGINGILGLEMAFEYIPDVIISDVMMPGKDGFEVCRIEQLLTLRKKLMLKFQEGQVSKIIAKQPKNAETTFIAKVIALIHEELDNSSFGTSELSFKLRLSESQVYRKLKVITGKSTAVFIRTVRLEAAKEHLQHTDKTVSEIAYAVGFNDPSWFSRAFKEEFGYPPSSINNQH